MATSALQAIPFSSMIGGLLKACIEAQAMTAKTTWDYNTLLLIFLHFSSFPPTFPKKLTIYFPLWYILPNFAPEFENFIPVMVLIKGEFTVTGSREACPKGRYLVN